MERRGNKVDIVQRVSCWISDMAFARFKSFSDRVLGIQIDEIPTVESILMRQNFSVVFYAAILFILTNGIYLVKNIAARSKENAAFEQAVQKPKRWIALQRKAWANRKTTRYFKCKGCGTVLSVPRGKGTLRVVCPKCKTETKQKS